MESSVCGERKGGKFGAVGASEGTESSPILFNIFHQAVVRVAEEERKLEARGGRRGGSKRGGGRVDCAKL